MQLNRNRFIKEILNVDFKGNTKLCAIALDVDPAYFGQMIIVPSKKGGLKLIRGVYLYCKKTGRDPEMFIFSDNEVNFGSDRIGKEFLESGDS